MSPPWSIWVLTKKYFANAPIYHDNQRFYQIRDDILTNNDPRDVLGFVVGKPKLPKPSCHRGCTTRPMKSWEALMQKSREWCAPAPGGEERKTALAVA